VTAQQPLDVAIAPGTSARALAKQLTRAGIEAPDWALFAYFRLSGDSRRIQAGSYEFMPGLTPKTLLDKLVRGDQAFRQITLIEGWNYRQVFQAIESARDVQQDTASMDVPDIMTAIGKPGVHPEGQFFPDTYRFPKNAKASSILRMASVALDRKLEQAWSQRDDGLPLQSPREALILASIIEKETGAPQDRADIGGVFINRMRIGMRLQTDPTVIYGLGERFDGNLRVDVGAGRLLDVEPGTGRFIGLVSIAEIPRRLTFDFSDFFRLSFLEILSFENHVLEDERRVKHIAT
jgi:UPF0755 protein